MRIKPRAAHRVILALAAAILGGCDSSPIARNEPTGAAAGPMPPGGRGMMGPGMMRGRPGGMMGASMQRHRWAMMEGIPAAYRGLQDPLSRDPAVISQGRSLYLANCAACHGDAGLGDGPAAAGLSPPPTNLRWAVNRPIASDGYLMWAISEGGATLGTPMPAFKDALSMEDRWRIIGFLRTL